MPECLYGSASVASIDSYREYGIFVHDAKHVPSLISTARCAQMVHHIDNWTFTGTNRHTSRNVM